MRERTFFGVTVSPVVVVLSDSGRWGERGGDVKGWNVEEAAIWDSDVPEVEMVVVVAAFSGSGLSFEAESEGRDSALGRAREYDEDRVRRP
jgi:hypothetical protein